MNLHARWTVTVVVVLGVALLQMGCSSSSRATFRCDQRVNEGILLTIDLVEIADDEVREIRETGDQWFYSDVRRGLRDRIKTISVKGGCDETVDLTRLTSKEKYLRKKKGYGTLAIIAEYQDSYESDGSMQFLPRQQWKGKTIVVRVHSAHLTIGG